MSLNITVNYDQRENDIRREWTSRPVFGIWDLDTFQNDY